MPSDQAAEPKVLPEPNAIAMTTGPAPERKPAQEVRKTVSIRSRTMSSDNYLQPNPKRAKATSSGPATPKAREPRPGARKTVTILFTDIVDSSRLGLSLDPEALRNLLTRYFDELSAVIQRHGGIVDKYIGDAIMAVFGMPLHEDDALRAVRAAVEMRERLAILNHELEAGWGVRREVNVVVLLVRQRCLGGDRTEDADHELRRVGHRRVDALCPHQIE